MDVKLMMVIVKLGQNIQFRMKPTLRVWNTRDLRAEPEVEANPERRLAEPQKIFWKINGLKPSGVVEVEI